MNDSSERDFSKISDLVPVTSETIEDLYPLVFAPWVRTQKLDFLEIEQGRVKARLHQHPDQNFFSGAMCGQAIMSGIDTIMSLAMLTYPRLSKGTVSQNNQFLRAAFGDDLIIESKVLKMGKSSAYGESFVTLEGSQKLVAHSTSEYAF